MRSKRSSEWKKGFNAKKLGVILKAIQDGQDVKINGSWLMDIKSIIYTLTEADIQVALCLNRLKLEWIVYKSEAFLGQENRWVKKDSFDFLYTKHKRISERMIKHAAKELHDFWYISNLIKLGDFVCGDF